MTNISLIGRASEIGYSIIASLTAGIYYKKKGLFEENNTF